MKKLYFICALFFLLAPSVVNAAPTPRDAVDVLNNGIVQNKNDGTALFKAIEKTFDLNKIAVLSIGRQRWREWSNVQRTEYVKVFTSYVLAIYQYRFRDYGGKGMEIYKVQARKNQALVYTRIEPKVDKKVITSTKPININFSVYNKKQGGKDNWLINDVYFKGTISEVASFRGSFSTLLKEKGHAGLIAEIKAKCKEQGKFCRRGK